MSQTSRSLPSARTFYDEVGGEPTFRALDRRAVDQRPRAGGGGEDEVRRGELVVERREPDPGAVAARERRAARGIAVDDAEHADAVAAAPAGGHLASLSRPDEQHAPAGERAERLPGELDRRRGDRRPV